MKISFQIIHDFKSATLKTIANALHLTLRDDLLLEINLRTAIDFVTLKFDTNLKTENNLCAFELNIDTTIYDLSKYEDFIEGFKERLKATEGFVKLLKYVDEIRTEEYVKYYKELAELEMRMREVFSYIFYNKYNVNGNDLFEEFDAKTAGIDEPKPDDLDKRLENKFFYLPFSGYLKFEKPKDVQVRELMPLIQSTEEYEQLRTHLNSRGIIKEQHIAFLQAVKTSLEPIENVRNCIAHNRQIPNRTEANYEKAKKELLKFIEDFWKSEISEIELQNEISFAEEFSFERVDNLLSVSDWNEYNNEVVVHDHWATGTPAYPFNDLDSLREFLEDEADNTANANFPSNADDREAYEQVYDSKRVVDKALNKYKKELIILSWI